MFGRLFFCITLKWLRGNFCYQAITLVDVSAAPRQSREFVDGGTAGIDADGDFAKRFERSELNFTGDVLKGTIEHD